MKSPTTVLVQHAGWRLILDDPQTIRVVGPDGRLAATVPTLKDAERELAEWLPNG